MNLEITRERLLCSLSGALFVIWVIYAFGISGVLFLSALAAMIAADYVGRIDRKIDTGGVDKENKTTY
jgi:hypothetical protein